MTPWDEEADRALEYVVNIPVGLPTTSVAPITDPRSIAGLLLWLDGSDITTVDGGLGAPVGTWSDKSGNSNNAIQLTALDKPNCIANIQNSLAAIDFGVTSGVQSNMAIATFVQNQPFTVFGAGITTVPTSTTGFMCDDTNNTSRVIVAWGQDVANEFAMYAGTAFQDDPHDTHNVWVVFVAVFNAGSSLLYMNNAAAVSGTNPGTNNFASIRLGNRFSAGSTNVPLNGYIGDFGVYNTALSPTDAGRVITWMKGKWAV